MVNITLSPLQNETILDTLRREGMAINSPCNGSGTCGKCRVRVSGQWVLACQTTAQHGVKVEMPSVLNTNSESVDGDDLGDEAQLIADCTIGNGLRLVDITLEPPSLDDNMPDAERLVRSLGVRLGTPVELTLSALQHLPDVLRANNFDISVVLRTGESTTVFDVTAPREAKALGLAIDIGTTGVAAIFCDIATGAILARASLRNAQTAYGADIIHRIVESTKAGGLARLRNAVLEDTIIPLIDRLVTASGETHRSVVAVSIAANPTMTQLLLGVPPDALRLEPYVPVFYLAPPLCASDVGIPVHPNARVLIAPAVGSYVGGDITAGVLASRLWANDELTLFIDLGTNGELVLGYSEYMMTCACSAGPAFEGGEISCGMRADVGAIDAVTIDTDTLEASFSVIGCEAPTGICGSGLIDIVAGLLSAKAIDGRGKFITDNPRISHDEHGIGYYSITELSNGSQPLTINETDIDNFIRAKAAVYSAILTMLEALSLEVSDISRVLIAGGIGGGINVKNAVAVGLLPPLDEQRFTYLGNTALIGAFLALVSDSAVDKLYEIGSGMSYLDLSTSADYMPRFTEQCFLWRGESQ